LSAQGHKTTAAADGEAAIAIAANSGIKPDLVIADYNLPRGLTGIQVMTRLRKILGGDLPALLLTGDISTETLREIALQGYLHRTKPINADDLTHIVQQLLAKPRIASQASAGRQSKLTGIQPETVFVVDDDKSVLEAIRTMLEAEGKRVEIYNSGEEFFASYRPVDQGCILVDSTMPGMSGLDLLRRLKSEGHHLPAVMITGDGDVHLAVQAMRAGATDFVEKPFSREELLASIGRALEHSPDTVEASGRRAAAAARLAGLTTREREVLDMVLSGQPSKNIAADLGISQRTIENHRASLMRKAGVRSLAALVRIALAAT
jgi:two-component system CheB/CheR fusion protein